MPATALQPFLNWCVLVRVMGLLTEAKERQKQKLSKQFISFYDSVLYLGEPKNEALEFVINNLRNEQTHLRLEYGELYLINIQRYQDEPDEYNYFTDDFISDHLTECVKTGYIDESNPIYNLGFAKKSFIEMLVCFGLPVSESEQKTVQSPDLAFNDDYFEVDYYTYEMIVNERDELRERLENQQPQTNSQLSQKVADQTAQIESLTQQLQQVIAEKAELQRQLNERLEQQAGKVSDTPADDKELSPVSQKAVTRLIYALLSEHGYELDGKRKGATNDQLVTLTKSHKVEIHRDTIATWLDRTNALKLDLQK